MCKGNFLQRKGKKLDTCDDITQVPNNSMGIIISFKNEQLPVSLGWGNIYLQSPTQSTETHVWTFTLMHL